MEGFEPPVNSCSQSKRLRPTRLHAVSVTLFYQHKLTAQGLMTRTVGDSDSFLCLSPRPGFEPTTPALQVLCSNQLSYGGKKLVSIYVVIPIHHSANTCQGRTRTFYYGSQCKSLFAVTNQIRLSWNWTKDLLCIRQAL